MKKVVVADDHPLVREGIRNVLEKAVDFSVSGEASDGKELMARLHDEVPDLVILDINMPGKSGLELLKDIKEWYPELPVLVLSIHPEKRMAVRAFKAGAWGYINKASISKEMINAIRKITFQKRRYINPEVAQQLVVSMDNNGNKQLHDRLSDREFQIMRLIAKGDTVNAIAKKLSLSPQTVYTYRDRIKEKMSLDSNVAITRYVMENNLMT